MTKSLEQKPDGYIPVDPKMGRLIDLFGESEDEAMRKVDESYYELNQGWELRPVKLVYLDEGK